MQCMTKDRQLIDTLHAKAVPTSVRFFVFQAAGVTFRVRADDDSHGVAHLRKLYASAIG